LLQSEVDVLKERLRVTDQTYQTRLDEVERRVREKFQELLMHGNSKEAIDRLSAKLIAKGV
jgi:hypothetical protein